MTNQEIFDFVAKKLIKQGKPSGKIIEDKFSESVKTFQCLYRSPDGYKCAAGHLIPNELYNPKMEGATSDAIFIDWNELGITDVSFVRQLQYTHDQVTSIDNTNWLTRWKDGMIDVATKYNLSTEVLN